MVQLRCSKNKKIDSIANMPVLPSEKKDNRGFSQISLTSQPERVQPQVSDGGTEEERESLLSVNEEREEHWRELVKDGVKQSMNEQYADSLKSFQASLKEQIIHSGDENDCMAHTLANIGSVYLKQGRLFLAAEALEEALRIKQGLREKLLKEEEKENIQIIGVINNLGNIAMLRGDFVRARHYYCEALREARKQKTANEELSNVLYNLGRLNILRNEWDAALSVLKAAMSLQTKLYGPESEVLAETMELLGFAYLSTNALDDAMIFFSEALSIHEEAFGAANARVATSLVHVGLVLEKRGQIRHAWKTFLAARDVFVRAGVHGDHHGFRAARRSLASLKKAIPDEEEQVRFDQSKNSFISIESLEKLKSGNAVTADHEARDDSAFHEL